MASIVLPTRADATKGCKDSERHLTIEVAFSIGYTYNDTGGQVKGIFSDNETYEAVPVTVSKCGKVANFFKIGDPSGGRLPAPSSIELKYEITDLRVTVPPPAAYPKEGQPCFWSQTFSPDSRLFTAGGGAPRSDWNMWFESGVRLADGGAVQAHHSQVSNSYDDKCGSKGGRRYGYVYPQNVPDVAVGHQTVSPPSDSFIPVVHFEGNGSGKMPCNVHRLATGKGTTPLDTGIVHPPDYNGFSSISWSLTVQFESLDGGRPTPGDCAF